MNREERYKIIAEMIEECDPDKRKHHTKISSDDMQRLWQAIYNYSANMKVSRGEVIDFILGLYEIDLLRDLTIAQYEEVMKMLGGK